MEISSNMWNFGATGNSLPSAGPFSAGAGGRSKDPEEEGDRAGRLAPGGQQNGELHVPSVLQAFNAV